MENNDVYIFGLTTGEWWCQPRWGLGKTKQHIRGEEGWIQHWANGVCWAYGKPVKSGPVHGSKMLMWS